MRRQTRSIVEVVGRNSLKFVSQIFSQLYKQYKFRHSSWEMEGININFLLCLNIDLSDSR